LVVSKNHQRKKKPNLQQINFLSSFWQLNFFLHFRTRHFWEQTEEKFYTNFFFFFRFFIWASFRLVGWSTKSILSKNPIVIVQLKLKENNQTLQIEFFHFKATCSLLEIIQTFLAGIFEFPSIGLIKLLHISEINSKLWLIIIFLIKERTRLLKQHSN